MNINNNKILIIIPAYNEEESILKTYKSVINYSREAKIKLDVIVINDGSTDRTEEICINHNIPYLKLKNNLGIGCAIQTGYKYAKKNNYDIAIQFDGDGQHETKCIKDLVKPLLNEGMDMVIGSRFIDKDNSNFRSSRSRRAGIKLIS